MRKHVFAGHKTQLCCVHIDNKFVKTTNQKICKKTNQKSLLKRSTEINKSNLVTYYVRKNEHWITLCLESANFLFTIVV